MAGSRSPDARTLRPGPSDTRRCARLHRVRAHLAIVGRPTIAFIEVEAKTGPTPGEIRQHRGPRARDPVRPDVASEQLADKTAARWRESHRRSWSARWAAASVVTRRNFGSLLRAPAHRGRDSPLGLRVGEKPDERSTGCHGALVGAVTWSARGGQPTGDARRSRSARCDPPRLAAQIQLRNSGGSRPPCAPAGCPRRSSSATSTSPFSPRSGASRSRACTSSASSSAVRMSSSRDRPASGRPILAISLAIAAVQSGRRVYYGMLADRDRLARRGSGAGR